MDVLVDVHLPANVGILSSAFFWLKYDIIIIIILLLYFKGRFSQAAYSL